MINLQFSKAFLIVLAKYLKTIISLEEIWDSNAVLRHPTLQRYPSTHKINTIIRTIYPKKDSPSQTIMLTKT